MQMDPNDPIYQAMIQASKVPHRASSPGGQQLPGPPARRAAGGTSRSPRPSSASGSHGAPPAAARARKHALAGVFGGEDEDEKPKRRFIPLQYTEEEARAMQAVPAAASSAAAPSAAAPAADPQAALKRLMDSLPKSKEGVFAYPVKWAVFDAAKAQLGPRVVAWVSKKIVELLGMEEETMVQFIMDKLSSHAAPAALLDELAMVLDEEAEGFVVRLFRMIMYETEKISLVS